jgi:hypothetical protein
MSKIHIVLYVASWSFLFVLLSKQLILPWKLPFLTVAWLHIITYLVFLIESTLSNL